MRIESVIDRLYCGGAMNDSATVIDTVRRHGITHILCLSRQCDCEKLHGTDLESVEVLHYEVPDDGAVRTLRWCIATLMFAHEVMKESGSVLFIHCAAGRNRSVSVCYGLLRMMGKAKEEAGRLMMAYGERICARDANFNPLSRIRYEDDIDRAVEWLHGAYTTTITETTT